MRNAVRVFLASIIAGIVFHFLPNLGIPLHSDVTWLFRLQTATDEALAAATPEGLKMAGAAIKGPFTSCRDWYQLTGRYNCADIIGLWTTARLARGNPDLWRLVYILFMSGAVACWYLVARALKTPRLLALILGLGLFLYPLDVWTDHKTAEPRAIFFLMLAYFFSLYPFLFHRASQFLPMKNYAADCLSALAMLLSVLSKETFITGWCLIPVFIYWRNIGNHIYAPAENQAINKVLRFMKQLLPHIAALAIFGTYIVLVRTLFPLATEGYAFSPSLELRAPLLPYYISYFKRILPIFFFGAWKEILLLFAFALGMAWRFRRDNLRTAFRLLTQRHILVLTAVLVLAVIASALPYYLTNRHVSGRFMLPGNFFAALLIAVIAAPFYKNVIYPLTRHLAPRARYALFAIILLAISLRPLDQLLHASAQNRIDQVRWQSLIDRVVAKAPRDGHVVLQFDEPYMIETAQSLEANTLFRGRYDLEYHLEFVNDESLHNNAFLANLIHGYSNDRDPLPSDNQKVLYVRADRKGTSINVPPPPFLQTFSYIFSSPRAAFHHRYSTGKTAYLNYVIGH